MSSSRNKGKQTATADQENHQHSRLRFLKPIVRLACFKLSLLIAPNELPNWTFHINLVDPDGRNARFRCF
ncbi:uncharacterized protein DS421_11g328590 [Arachis hypogaea]|nr:uncharacterized protein DS421_11g328590 [Arachis hypogaea]